MSASRSLLNDQWIGLDLRHLVALRAIADEGSFKGAARVLGYTPSAISQQIGSLERVVGVQVIAREHGRQALGLTEAGKILLRHMSAIEARLSAAKSEIDAFARGIAGPLRVGAYESVGAHLLPELLGRFREDFPDVRVEVDDAPNDLDLLRSVERGVLDLAFTLLPLPRGPFQARVVLSDPWVLVARAGSEHAGQAASARTLREIGQLPLVCNRMPRAIDPVLSAFRAVGVEPNILLRSDYNDALQELAAVGLGIALMPRLAVNPYDERTAIVELGDLIPKRDIAVAWHSERTASEAFASFVSLAVEVGAALDGSGPSSVEWRRTA
jgi:DNA-binding transcriptional LysR family regulator